MDNFLSINTTPQKSMMMDPSGKTPVGVPETVDKMVALVENEKDSKEEVAQENLEYQDVVAYVKKQFDRAKTHRRTDDDRKLECYRNFRGLYGPDVQFTDTEKSRAFIKITKTKVLAAYSKVSEILFSANKFPIGVEPTPSPEGVLSDVHFDPKEPKNPNGGASTPDEGGGEEDAIPGTITRGDIYKGIQDRLGPLKESLSRLPESVELKEGTGKTPTSYNFEPAAMAAKKMEKKIHDMLEESNADKALRSFVFEMCLFGTGIMKGPVARDKEYPKWDDQGKYSPQFKLVGDILPVSYWNFYPDPDARSMEDVEFCIERHRLNRTNLRALKKRPFFRTESIELAIDQGPDYMNETWEDILKDYENTQANGIQRYEVLEYWGVLDKEVAEKANLEIPEELKEMDQVQVNIWICNDQLLRLVLNPFTPSRIPYYACPYEVNPYSFFGIGVAENMLDTQLIMNGFMRLAIDNAALSSNVVFEIDETSLIPGQDTRIYPGKVFRRQSGAPGQAIFATKYPNVTQECILLFDKARQLSDEATGMPSYAHGISGVMSTGRTASGMSMLMQAADQNIKSVIRNIDDYLLVPLGKGLFAFNMQFSHDKDIKGDLDIVAKGTESLMRNEVRSQRLLQFLQVTGNPMDAPFVKRDYILREFAEALDLDPEKIVNDPREAAIQAEMMREINQALGVPMQSGMGTENNNPAGVAQPGDPGGTGGGNIAPGMSPEPTSDGFTGNNMGGVPAQNG